MRTCVAVSMLLAALPLSLVHAEDVVRYPLPNGNKFPIARAVEVPAGTTLIFHSGMTPSPKDPNAPKPALTPLDMQQSRPLQRQPVSPGPLQETR